MKEVRLQQLAKRRLHNGDRVRESKCCKKVTVCTRTNAGYRKRLKRGHFCTFFAALRWIFIVSQIGEWEVILRIILYLFHIHHFLVLRILNAPKVFMWCQDKPWGGGVFRKRNGRPPKGGKYCQDARENLRRRYRDYSALCLIGSASGHKLTCNSY